MRDKRGNGDSWASSAVELLVASRYSIAITGVGCLSRVASRPFAVQAACGRNMANRRWTVTSAWLTQGYWEERLKAPSAIVQALS